MQCTTESLVTQNDQLLATMYNYVDNKLSAEPLWTWSDAHDGAADAMDI